MAQERTMGYVVGSDIVQGRTTWKVRSEAGEKFEVASVRGGIALAPGLNVSFLIGRFNKESGQDVRRAVDVMLAVDSRDGKKRANDYADPEYLSFTVEVIGESRFVYMSGYETEQEARDEIERDEFGGFFSFSERDLKEVPHLGPDIEDLRAGFRVISSLFYVESTRDALEQLLTAVYKQGLMAGKP